MNILPGGYINIVPVTAVFIDTSGSTRLYAHTVNDLFENVTIYWSVADDSGNVQYSSSTSISLTFYMTGLGDPSFIFNYLVTLLNLTTA